MRNIQYGSKIQAFRVHFNERILYKGTFMAWSADKDSALVELWDMDGEYFGRVWIGAFQLI